MTGTLTLYDSKLSGNAWKVRLLLRQLGRPFRRVSFNLPEGKTRTPEFLAKNPMGKVPVLETPEGETIFESNAILTWLARGTKFLPDEPMDHARVMQWLLFEQSEVLKNLAGPRFAISIAKKTEGREAEIAAWHTAGYRALGIIDGHLAKHPFFVADRYTIADIAHFPYVSMADQGGYEMARFPHIAAWLDRVRAQPNYTPLVED